MSAYRLESTPRLRPTIVCLCGSTRFVEAFREANRSETMAGRIVLGPGVFGWAGDLPERDCVSGPVKMALDDLHLRKIGLADEVLILNVDGYLGESTRRELDYARARGKSIRFLEDPGAEGRGIADAYPYVWWWRWRLPERTGQPCRVIARGALNSALVDFPDGFWVITSRWAVRRASA